MTFFLNFLVALGALVVVAAIVAGGLYLLLSRIKPGDMP